MFGEYFSFIDVVPDTSLLHTGQHDYGLVLLSIGIAVFAAYTALFVAQFAEQTEDRKSRFTLLTLGGVTLGVGVWSMHFIGMLGFSIPCGVTYDPWLTALSMVPGVLAGIFSLHLISSRNKSTRMLLIGGVIFGGGVGVMHYSGMAAMRMDAFLRYDPMLFLLSILVAVLLAVFALWVRFGIIRLFPALEKHALLIASLVMGGAVSGMHYTAMSAAYFLVGDVTRVSATGFDPTMLAMITSGVTAFFIAIVFIYVFKQITRQIEHINIQLRDTNNELKFQQAALDHHAIVSMADIKGNITYVNDNFCKTSKYSRDKLLGKNHRIINSDEHPDSFFKTLWHTIANGKVWQGEVKNRARDGSFYWVYSTIVPFLNENGKPYKYISVRTDITAIKETEAILHKAKEAAEKANTAKSEFLANMSHELRSPMTSIKSGLSTIKEVLVDPEADDEDKADMMQAIDFAQGSSERLLGLLNDILDLAKLEAGKMEFNIQPANLTDVIKLALQEISSQAQAKSLILKSDICVQDTTIPIDSGKIMQVVINLLNNAVKFTPEGREICISLSEGTLPSGRRETDIGDRPALKLIVSDQGVGIPGDELSHIFDKFAQSKKTKDGSGGTGLGLSIVQSIVLAHNGSIHVENNPEGGASFIVSIPRGENSHVGV